MCGRTSSCRATCSAVALPEAKTASSAASFHLIVKSVRVVDCRDAELRDTTCLTRRLACVVVDGGGVKLGGELAVGLYCVIRNG